jgi:hypothetical protein
MTQTQKDATAIHTSAATNAAVTHYELTARQAVDPVGVDTPSQSQQPATVSTLPNAGLFHPSQASAGLRGAVEGSNGGSDPGKRGDNAASSLNDIKGAADALRNSVLDGLQPTKAPDPTHRGDLNDSATPSKADLAALLGLPGTTKEADPNDRAARDAHKGQQTEESMVGIDSNEWDYKGKDGAMHHTVVMRDPDHDVYYTSDKNLKTGTLTVSVFYKDDDGNEHHKVATTDKNAKVPEGMRVEWSKSHESNGSTTHIPDEDHQTNKELQKEAQKEAQNEHLPRHVGDNINVVDSDIPGTVSTADTKAVVISGKENLIANPGSADAAGGHIGGGPAPRPTGGDIINDLNATTQGTGPEERTQPTVQTGPIAPAHPAQPGNSGDQSGSDSHDVSQVVGAASKTATQQAAQDLVNSVAPSHADSTTKTAQSVDGVHSGHDIASVLGGTVSAHDNGGFADLIRLAQNPAQSGLVPPPVSAGHDAIAALQLSTLGDPAGHGGDVHHDDVHAAAAIALPVAVHEEVSHLTAAAIDHGHATH